MQAVVADQTWRELLLAATSDKEYEKIVMDFARKNGYYVRA
jgi:hypothetical protein